jgi:hypothetical protein
MTKTEKLTAKDGKKVSVNACDLSAPFTLVHDGNRVIQITPAGKGTLRTRQTVFEADTQEAIDAEIKRLGLTKEEEPRKRKSE